MTRHDDEATEAARLLLEELDRAVVNQAPRRKAREADGTWQTALAKAADIFRHRPETGDKRPFNAGQLASAAAAAVSLADTLDAPSDSVERGWADRILAVGKRSNIEAQLNEVRDEVTAWLND